MKVKILLIMMLSIFSHCKNVNHRDESSIFNGMLKSEFNTLLPEEKHYYILVPKIICSGCVYRNLDSLNYFINVENKNNFTLIYSDHKNLIPEKLFEKINIYFDKTGKIDILPLNVANITLVKSENCKVVFIRSVNSMQDESITKWIN